MDPELAAGLQHVLQFEDGAGSMEEVFGVTFTASAHPLIPPSEEEKEVPYLTYCTVWVVVVGLIHAISHSILHHID